MTLHASDITISSQRYSLAKGAAVIAGYVKTLPTMPGVYRMLNLKGEALYVGKAKNLKKRVFSYTQTSKLPHRLQRMVAETVTMEFITTHTETEALLLEANLIKQLEPRYNILLRDGKTFAYIALQKHHPIPQLHKYRGPLNLDEAEYFGPFASVEAVNETLTALHRAFLLRSCPDTVFSTRKRPCLQYHIKRCSAPCVSYISQKDYAVYVDQARDFLRGKSHAIQKALADQMHEASLHRSYEKAAILRDRIRALTHIQSQQIINIAKLQDADVIAAHQEANETCIQAFFFRHGGNYGNSSFFLKHDPMDTLPTIVESFLMQLYVERPAPPLLLLNVLPHEREAIEKALRTRSGHKVTLVKPVRGAQRDVIRHAETNAKEALNRRLAETATQKKIYERLAQTFQLSAPPERIEVYDNSHIQGKFAVGAMIVATSEGFLKKAYRKFNIKTLPQTGVTGGDDYAMMREVFSRRFGKALSTEHQDNSLPDLIFVDGGPGQLNAALETLADLGAYDLTVVAISKGSDRAPGEEKFHQAGVGAFTLPNNDATFYYIQRLRDEAHRFAIGAHRMRRQKAIGVSLLDSIPGIGPARKRALLRHFGSAVSVSKAGLRDLQAVDGISAEIAKKIYEHFHAER